jgi:hypothetical protein
MMEALLLRCLCSQSGWYRNTLTLLCDELCNEGWTKYLKRTKVGLQSCLGKKGKMPFELHLEALVRFGTCRMWKGYGKQRKRHVQKGTGMAGGVVQVVECLPGKLEALS